MNRIFAALVLSTAAIGAAQASGNGETGYADNPATQQTSTRADAQRPTNADRNTEARAQGNQQTASAKPANPSGVAFVNG